MALTPHPRHVCKLSNEEVLALRIYGIMPDHNSHQHLRRNKAIEMIETDMACIVGEEYGLQAIIEHSSNNYVWKTRDSGGVNCRQMVRLVQG